MAHLKVVLDVNVLVSALFGGIPAEAARRAEAMTILISDPIEAEMFAVADELPDKVPAEAVHRFRRHAKRLIRKAEHVDVPGLLHLCRDPADDVYLETCQVGRAHYLVTGDRDLLELDRKLFQKHKLGRLEIVTPATFVAQA